MRVLGGPISIALPLSPCAARPTLPLCITLHADLRTRLHAPFSFLDTDPQLVFWPVPGGLETRALAYSKRVLILASPCFCFSPTDSAYKHQSAASFPNFQPSRCSAMRNNWELPFVCLLPVVLCMYAGPCSSPGCNFDLFLCTSL